MATKWTDELRNEITDLYIEKMEALENDGNKSADVINEIRESLTVDGHTFTANAIRLMLMAQRRPTEEDSEGIVYIKKPAGASTASSGSSGKSGGGTARVSKAEAQKQLTDAISAINPELVDAAIIEKLTGKAAQYFTGVILELNAG